MAMSDAEFKSWKMRLDYAHRLWAENGWIPNKQDAKAKYSVARFLDGYRGDFPMSMRGARGAEADQMVGNIMFSIINTQVAQVSGRPPDLILRPLGGDAASKDARRRAWLNEQLIEAMFKEKKFKREVDQAVLSAVLCGAGFVRHGYTPEVEYTNEGGKIIARFKNQKPDMPWIQFRRVWQIRIDPLVDSFDPDSEPRWCAFHNLYFEDQIRGNENLIMRRDWSPTHTIKVDGDRTTGQSNEHSPEMMEMYEEWVVYDATERRFFGMSPGSEKLVREEREWPFDWGQLPYSSLIFNDQLDTPFPIAFPRMFYDEQLLYNRVWTIINALVSRFRRVVFYQESAFNDDQKAILKNPDALMEFVEAEGQLDNALKETQIGANGFGELLGILFQLKEQIREVLGVSSFDRAQRANVETAAEAQQIGAGSTIARSRTQEKVESLWANIAMVTHRAFLQSEDAREMTIPIIGRENLDFLDQSDRANGFIVVNANDLAGEFSYQVKQDSTLRSDPNTAMVRLSTSYNLMGGVQSKLLDQRFWHEQFSELGGADPKQAVLSEEMAARMTEQPQPEEDAQNTGVEAAAQNSVGTGFRGVLGAV